MEGKRNGMEEAESDGRGGMEDSNSLDRFPVRPMLASPLVTQGIKVVYLVQSGLWSCDPKLFW